MKIYIIGKTDPWLFHLDATSRAFGPHMPGKASESAFEDRYRKNLMDPVRDPGQALIEFAGRLCYESWDMPNPKTATNSGYIENIISQGHESVLEHVSVTFYVEGVSRNLSHELIRHRHLSFSELSQRFVDMSEARMVMPPAVRDGGDFLEPVLDTIYYDDYSHISTAMQSDGKTRKQAREAARYYLPSAMETKFVVTGNLRAWRDVLKKRDSEHADAEMQLLAKEMKRQLLAEYPDVFKDLADADS